ncbi:hypothetical protein LTS10_005800 [Elasticomyces elasticus]|nr:hypothetical protein LTS10_005800 [Elasticomyces elasticus]
MRFLARIKTALVCVVSFSYDGPLRHYTIGPIRELERHQDDPERVYHLIQRFKELKLEELQTVQKASALSAAAIIGTFSWPGTSSSFWPSQLFWYNGLWFSIFALVSFSQQRMIDQIPTSDPKQCSNIVSQAHAQSLLHLFLKPTGGEHDIEATRGVHRRFVLDWRLAYAWQTPTMLMSYAWLSFMLGYAMYLLTPLLSVNTPGTSRASAIVEICLGGIAAANFELNCRIARRAIRRVRKSLEVQHGTEASTSSVGLPECKVVERSVVQPPKMTA